MYMYSNSAIVCHCRCAADLTSSFVFGLAELIGRGGLGGGVVGLVVGVRARKDSKKTNKNINI
jgi:hypothetical protein